jgi:hypothetical protein
MSNSGDYQDIREQLEEKITNLKKQTIWSLLIVLFLIIAAVFLNIQLKKSNMSLEKVKADLEDSTRALKRAKDSLAFYSEKWRSSLINSNDKNISLSGSLINLENVKSLRREDSYSNNQSISPNRIRLKTNPTIFPVTSSTFKTGKPVSCHPPLKKHSKNKASRFQELSTSALHSIFKIQSDISTPTTKKSPSQSRQPYWKS